MRFSEILSEALRLLREMGWTQGAYARDANDKEVHPSDKRAACFCSEGAIVRAGQGPDNGNFPGAVSMTPDELIAEDFLRAAVRIFPNEGGILDWNDYERRKKKEVFKAFEAAIVQAEEL